MTIRPTPNLDDPDYRAQLEYLVSWLADGTELEKLIKLKEEVLANPVKRQVSRYRVRNPDGSIYRKPVRKALAARRSPKKKIK